jgi:hypothetical protein
MENMDYNKLLTMYIELLKENKELKEELNDVKDDHIKLCNKYNTALTGYIELSKKCRDIIDVLIDIDNADLIRDYILDIFDGVDHDDNEIVVNFKG